MGTHGHAHGGAQDVARGAGDGAGAEGAEGRGRQRRRLALTLGLAATYMVAEVVGGLLTGSLALLADAGHMLSDVAALALSLVALWLAQRPATDVRTFGWQRAEILAALANGVALVAIALVVVVEAIGRLGEPPPVEGGLMLAVAAGGLAVNVAGLVILHGGRRASLNLRGAWLHVLSDALGSLGAMAAAGAVLAFDWRWADPAASIAIAVLVAISALGLLRETVAVLLEAAPAHIDVAALRDAMGEVPGVVDVHDLHVWTITSGLVSLSCHVQSRDDVRDAEILARLQALLKERFAIDHATIQLEPEHFDEGHVRVC